jgi:Uma2 family endonuclease
MEEMTAIASAAAAATSAPAVVRTQQAAAAEAQQEAAAPSPARDIPEALIYEVVNGKPIYYKGYRDYLSGAKTIEEIMADSTLQSWLKAQLTILLGNFFAGKGFDITTGELGLLLGRGRSRGADVSIFREENLTLDEHYSKTAPEVIIEIDVQADLSGSTEHEMQYVMRKVDDYFRFGVKQVIWVFSASQKVMNCKPGQPWLTTDWDTTIETVEGATFNIAQIIERKKPRTEAS